MPSAARNANGLLPSTPIAFLGSIKDIGLPAWMRRPSLSGCRSSFGSRKMTGGGSQCSTSGGGVAVICTKTKGVFSGLFAQSEPRYLWITFSVWLRGREQWASSSRMRLSLPISAAWIGRVASETP